MLIIIRLKGGGL